MIDDKLITIINTRIDLEIEESFKHLAEEINERKTSAEARGMLLSGMTAQTVTRLCIDFQKAQIHLMWTTIHRFITSSNYKIESSFRDDVSTLLNEIVEKYNQQFIGEITKICSLVGVNNNLEKNCTSEFLNEQARTIQKIMTEVDLYIMSEEKKQESAGNTFNIYSPVGSIQTGANSVANVTQTIEASDKTMIIETLDNISKQINESTEVAPASKTEILELVSDSKAELDKSSPNMTKLKSLIFGVGTSIQIIASLKPAYDALKMAAPLIGISLP